MRLSLKSRKNSISEEDGGEAETAGSKRLWPIAIRVTLGLLSIGVILTHVIALSRQTTTCLSGLLVISSIVLAWRRRALIGPIHEKYRSFTSRWLRYPGYLRSLSIAFAVAGIYLASMPIATIAAVFFVGWLAGRRVTALNWGAFAPAWMLLFLVCVPPGFALTSIGAFDGWGNEVASAKLDSHGVHHLISDGDLVLVGADRVVSLRQDVLFSSYHLFAMSLAVAICARLPAFLTTSIAVFAAFAAALLQPLRILVAGCLCEIDGLPTWIVPDYSMQLIAFATAGMLLLACFGFISLFFGPIRPKRKNPVNEISRTRAFLQNYIATRRWRYACLAFPAVTILVAATMKFGSSNRLDVVSSYQARLSESVREKDFVASERVLDRLFVLTPQVVEPGLQLANALLEAGNWEAAKQLANRLLEASPDKTMIRLWLASKALTNDPKHSAGYADAKGQISAVIAKDRANWKVIADFALLASAHGDRADAGEALRLAKPIDHEGELEIARIQHRLGFAVDANFRASRLIRELKTKPNTGDPLTERLRLAEAMAIADDLEGAIEILETEVERTSKASGVLDARLKDVFSKTLLSFCLSPEADRRKSRCDRLRRAEEIDSSNLDLVHYCAWLIYQVDDLPTAKEVEICKRVVKAALKSEQVSIELLVILGTGAANKNDTKNAEIFLTRAYERGNRDSLLLNNLAWVICQRSDGDYPFALQLVNEAMRTKGRSADMHSTRAEIYVRMERYKDAIVDLEIVQNLTGQKSDACKQLADLYERIGDPETAKQYRELFTSLPTR